MTQVWDDDNRVVPVTVLRVRPCRVVQVKTNERDGYSALQVTFGQKKASKLTKPVAGQFTAAGVDPGTAPRRAAARRRQRLRGRSGDRRRRPVAGRARRRDLGQQGQGHRRRHEAPRLLRPRRQPRRPPGPPGARRHRRLRHAVPRVQGHPHGRPDRRPEDHHPQPHRRPGRRRARPAAGQGRRARAQGRHRPRPRRRRRGSKAMATLKLTTAAGKASKTSVDLDDAYFDVQPNVAGHAPGRHGPARRPAGRHAVDQDPRRGARRRRQAVAPEGHRPGPPGLDPRPALAWRRRHPRPQAPQLQAAHAQEDDPPGAGLGPVRPPRRRQGHRARRLGHRHAQHQGRGRGARQAGRRGPGARGPRPRRGRRGRVEEPAQPAERPRPHRRRAQRLRRPRQRLGRLHQGHRCRARRPAMPPPTTGARQ